MRVTRVIATCAAFADEVQSILGSWSREPKLVLLISWHTLIRMQQLQQCCAAPHPCCAACKMAVPLWPTTTARVTSQHERAGSHAHGTMGIKLEFAGAEASQ